MAGPRGSDRPFGFELALVLPEKSFETLRRARARIRLLQKSSMPAVAKRPGLLAKGWIGISNAMAPESGRSAPLFRANFERRDRDRVFSPPSPATSASTFLTQVGRFADPG